MSTLTMADALRLAVNVLRDAAESRRLLNGTALDAAANTRSHCTLPRPTSCRARWRICRTTNDGAGATRVIALRHRARFNARRISSIDGHTRE